jgi:lactate racemase
VIVSPGGYPRDINLYQTQKSMESASFAVRQGGVIVMLAECADGHGSDSYFRHVSQFATPEEAMEAVRREFHIGPHKTYLTCKTLRKAETILVSKIPEDQVRKMLFTPASSLEEALELAYKKLGPTPKTYVMPAGQVTFPRVRA